MITTKEIETGTGTETETEIETGNEDEAAKGMTREQAELRTGLTGRQMTGKGKNDFLTCQLGRNLSKIRRNPRDGTPMPVLIFHLKGYGETWESAVKRAKL